MTDIGTDLTFKASFQIHTDQSILLVSGPESSCRSTQSHDYSQRGKHKYNHTNKENHLLPGSHKVLNNSDDSNAIKPQAFVTHFTSGMLPRVP